MPRPRLVVALLFAVLCAVSATWLLIDRRPPEWDHANHLERAVDCYRSLRIVSDSGAREILEASSFYPPLVTCAAGALYFLFPIVPLTAQAVMMGFLGVAMACVYGLGRRLSGPETGLWAAFFLGTAPFVVFSLTNFQLDLPLAAMVALALYALVRAEAFTDARWSLALGVALGLGMLTKPPFAIYQLYFRLAAGLEVPYLAIVLVLVAIAILSNIPISVNGIGLREQLHYLLFASLGVSKELAVGISVIVFSHFLILSVFGGLVWFRLRARGSLTAARP